MDGGTPEGYRIFRRHVFDIVHDDRLFGAGRHKDLHGVVEGIGERAFAWHIVDAINSAKRNEAQGL
jgi:hypothetical protein